jgi:hypothetical protein
MNPFLRTLLLSGLVLISARTLANNTALSSGPWENGGNWSSGAAPLATDNVVIPAGMTMTVNAAGDLCGNLNIANGGSVVIEANEGLTIGGNLANAGTFTAKAFSMVTFDGNANCTITGGGTYTIAGTIVLNMGSAATSLDIQDANFITGINSGGNYFFTFKKGTWIMDNAAAWLNDSYNSGSTNALTIPYGVTIQVNSGVMTLAKNGTMATIGDGLSTYGQSNIVLSGKLFVNGGTVLVALGQAVSNSSGQTLNMGVDLQYYVNGGTPQLYITSGSLVLGSGFDYYSNSDYVDFEMTGGTVTAAVNGSSFMGTFQLNDVVGGMTVMSGGLIQLTDASWGYYPDIDLGGPNVKSTLYSVTGGTVQFGSPLTANAGTYFSFEAWATTNYPNFDFESGIAKVAQPLNNSDFRVYSVKANANMTFSVADYFTGNTTKNMYVDGNNGAWAFDVEGTWVPGTSTVHFTSSFAQAINSTAFNNVSFYNVNIENQGVAFTFASGNVTTLNVGGTLTVNTGVLSPGTMTTLNVSGDVILNAGSLMAPANINASGNWTNNGGAFVPGSNTVNFVGAGNESINGTAASQTFYNVVADLGGNLTGPSSLSVKGNMLLTAGTFTGGTNTNIAGNFTNNDGGFNANGKTVTFNGSSAQTIGGSSVTTFNNLGIANTSGNVILGIAANVNNQLAFTKGLVDASSYPLTITNGVSATGASSTSYVIVGNGVSSTGSVIIQNLPPNTATLFPIGTSSYYFPATLNPGINSGQAFSTYVYTPASYNAIYGGPAFPAALATNILSAVWNVNETIGTGSATLGVNWASSGTTLDGTAFQSAGTNIGISQFVGGNWQTATGSGNVATTSATSSFGTFSQFLVSTQNVVLPLGVTDFNAVLNGNNTVGLSWTAPGIGFSNFVVQRSNDGIDWSNIGTVAANAADANGQYAYTDLSPFSGTDYYRLISEQTDGNSSYSNIRTVNLANVATVGIYPNPTSDQINVSLSNATPDLCIRLVSLNGQVLETVKPGVSGASVTTIDVRHYPAAIYLVQLSNTAKVIQVASVVVHH